MTPIELTEQHKRKLLEMLKYLYKDLHEKAYAETVEYYGSKEEADVNTGGIYITGDNHIQCSYPIDERDDSFHEHLIEGIHWFEFVMTSLVEKLSELNQMNEYMPPYVQNVFPGANGMWNLYTRFHFHYPKNNRIHHPVDYLYEQFKKIQS